MQNHTSAAASRGKTIIIRIFYIAINIDNNINKLYNMRYKEQIDCLVKREENRKWEE